MPARGLQRHRAGRCMLLRARGPTVPAPTAAGRVDGHKDPCRVPWPADARPGCPEALGAGAGESLGLGFPLHGVP